MGGSSGENLGVVAVSNWRQNQPKNRVRATEMAAAYLGGETLQSIGDRYGVSRERVRQICTQQGVSKENIPALVGFHKLNTNDLRWRYAWSSAGAAWWERHHQTKPIRRAQVRKLREWVRETGRTDPTIAETLAIVGERNVVALAACWGRQAYVRKMGFVGVPYTRYLDRLRKLGGVVARSRGSKGHKAPQGSGRRWATSLAFDAKVRPFVENGLTAAEIARIIGAKRTMVWVAMQRIRRDDETP